MIRLDLTRKKTPLEKPTVLVRMADHSGNPMVSASVMRSECWKKIDYGAVFAAAGQVLFHRKLKAGEIGLDDGITPTQEEIVNVIEWADLRQLQLLRKIAESIEKEPLH